MRTKAFWRDPALGTARELDLPQGRLRYFESGTGTPIVFIHGLLVNANLWRKVVARLSPDARCIALDLPLGSHELALPASTPLDPPALADLIADAIEAIGLEDVTLVGNDTGGALCQLVVTRRPERIGRLVLTPCDYRDNFPPRAFRPLVQVSKVPGVTQAILTALRPRAVRRLPLVFGWLTKRPIDPAAEDSYLYPSLVDAGVRTNGRRVMHAVDTRFTNEAADRLHEFDRPALIAWAKEDRFFPTSHAEELATTLPQARLEWVHDSYTFAAEDAPERLAELIRDFVREPVGVQAR